jgi:hypothetical protein
MHQLKVSSANLGQPWDVFDPNPPDTTQVTDWQRFVRDNVHTVRNEMSLPNIYDPRGMMVMGRSRDVQGDEAVIDQVTGHEKYT